MALRKHSKLCFCKFLWTSWPTSILWRTTMDILLFWGSLRIIGANTLNLTEEISKASFRNFVKADSGQPLECHLKTRTSPELKDFPLPQMQSKMWALHMIGTFSYEHREWTREQNLWAIDERRWYLTSVGSWSPIHTYWALFTLLLTMEDTKEASDPLSTDTRCPAGLFWQAS